MKKIKPILYMIATDALGGFFVGLALIIFAAPNQITPGGVGGLSVMLNHMTQISIGTWNMILNIPLLILSFFLLDKRTGLKTLKTIFIASFIMNYVVVKLPVFQGDLIIAAIFAGIFLGIGVSIFFRNETTGGGSDIVTRMINKYYPQLQLGQIVLAIDATVVFSSIFVFGDLKLALYGIVLVYIASTVIDKIMYGAGNNKLVYIVSEKKEEICRMITEHMGQSVTVIKAFGGYSHQEKDIIMCGVTKTHFYKLKKNVLEMDQEAFITVLSADEMTSNKFQKN